MQCRPALTFVLGAIFGATVVLVVPRDASGASRSTTPAAPGRRLAVRSNFAADCAGNDACERTLEESAALGAAAAEFKEQKMRGRPKNELRRPGHAARGPGQGHRRVPPRRRHVLRPRPSPGVLLHHSALGRISLQEAPMRRGRRRGDAGVSGVRLAVRCATPRPCSPLLSLTTTLASLHHKPDNSKSR